MNTVVTSENPIEPREAVDALKANGFEKLHPKTRFYRFYWIKSTNTVVLTAEGIHPIFPEELADKVFDSEDRFDLTFEYGLTKNHIDIIQHEIKLPDASRDPSTPLSLRSG